MILLSSNLDLARSDSESTLSVSSIRLLDDGDTDADSTLPYVEEDFDCCPDLELQTEEVLCYPFSQWSLKKTE